MNMQAGVWSLRSVPLVEGEGISSIMFKYRLGMSPINEYLLEWQL